MNPTRNLHAAALALACLLVPIAVAQNSTRPLSSDEVHIPVLITDERGAPISGVTSAQLSVSEDKNTATSFDLRPAEGLPLYIGLLIDSSNSEQKMRGVAVQTVSIFLNHVMATAADRAFISTFSNTMKPAPWMDKSQISEYQPHLQLGGGTALYDAVGQAATVEGQTPLARRVLVLVTDGEDNQSHTAHEEAVAQAQKAGVVIFSVSTNGTGPATRGDRMQKQFSEATGGIAFFPEQTEQVRNAFAIIADQITHMYLLTYVPAPSAAKNKDGHHDIEIEPAGQKLFIRAAKRRF